jgi:hypothetical protein
MDGRRPLGAGAGGATRPISGPARALSDRRPCDLPGRRRPEPAAATRYWVTPGAFERKIVEFEVASDGCLYVRRALTQAKQARVTLAALLLLTVPSHSFVACQANA